MPRYLSMYMGINYDFSAALSVITGWRNDALWKWPAEWRRCGPHRCGCDLFVWRGCRNNRYMLVNQFCYVGCCKSKGCFEVTEVSLTARDAANSRSMFWFFVGVIVYLHNRPFVWTYVRNLQWAICWKKPKKLQFIIIASHGIKVSNIRWDCRIATIWEQSNSIAQIQKLLIF